MLVRFLAYVRAWLTRRRIDGEADDELRFHIEQETAVHVARGASPAEARRLALRDLGGLTQVKEAVREVRGTLVDRTSRDVRDALRALRSGGSTTAMAFGILVLAMAAGTTTFSVVDGVALRPLPYSSPEQLVALAKPSPLASRQTPASPQQYFEWLDKTRSFVSLGAATFSAALPLEVNGEVSTATALRVTTNLFDVLGIRPLIGRFFGPDEESAASPDGIILSYDFWSRRFGRDPAVVGRRFTSGPETREVVGILPAGVRFPITAGPAPDLYVPYVATAAERSNSRCCVEIVGRLRPGVDIHQARADVQRISPAVVASLTDQVVGPAAKWLVLVLAAVACVLIVACVNVACLLLARAATRVPEFATREALGASRGQLVCALFTEGLILAIASASAGLFVAYNGLEFVKSQLPAELTRISSVAINGRVLTMSVVTAALSVLMFSSAPAWLVARSDLMGYMKGSGGAVVGGRWRDRALAAFMVADIGLVAMLLVATVLVVTSFVLVTTADLGFDRQNVMSVNYQRSLQGVAPPQREAAAFALRHDLIDRVRSVPGVIAVAISANGGAPLDGGSVRYSVEIPGVGETTGDDMLETRIVTPDYFRVLGMRLIRGRTFTSSDRTGAPNVMVINDVAARRFFGEGDPIGQVVAFRGATTIIGVVKGVNFQGPEADVRTAMYTPVDQDPYQNGRLMRSSGNLLIHTADDPRRMAPAIREAIRVVLNDEPAQPTFVDDSFRRITAGRRFNSLLMSAFGLLAVILGAVGVYGTVAFVVARQVRPLGLRMALGATRSNIVTMVVREALQRVAVGVGVGLTVAWAGSTALTAFVFQITPTEPAVYVGVAVFLAAVGFAAAFIPALRAARVDPLVALRSE